jgi:plastocyanin
MALFLAVTAGLIPDPAAAEESSGAGIINGTVSATPMKYAAGVVVHLVGIKGTFRPSAKASMDQKGMRFIPHVLPVLKGTTVDFLNSDSVRHNVFSPDGTRFNLGTWPQGQTKAFAFSQTGVYRMLCNVHAEMEAFIVVLENPYFAVTERDGTYQIKGVPAGSHTVRAWSEKLAEATQPVTVPASGSVDVNFALKRGR